MKFKIFVNPIRPKVRIEKIQKMLQSLDLQISETTPDIALVIGGDGTFSHYGKKLSIPMLFVGVPTSEILGSKSRLAEISLPNLTKTLRNIVKKKYVVIEKRMLDVKYGNSPLNSILTDVYLERGLFAGCIRYSTSITNKNIDNKKNNNNSSKSAFTDYVIGNGVIISTSFGSGGYYSYLDRIKNPKQKSSDELFDDTKLGVCHILPTFATRCMKDQVNRKETVPIRYTVPDSSKIEITVIREANIRLYGTTVQSKGVKITWNKPISVTSSAKTAKIIRLI